MVLSKALALTVAAVSLWWLGALSAMAQDEAIARRQKLMKGFSARS